MQFLNRIFTFYIFSNLHVSFAAFCFVKITLINYEIKENIVPIFVLFSTIVSYNFIRFYRINEINLIAATWLRSNRTSLMILNIICIIVLIFVSFKFTIKDFISLSPFALATIFYVIPLWSKGKNLRNVVSLKLFLIAFSWAGVTVLFPLIHEEITFSSNVWITFFQRFLFIVAVTIPFDIRDLNFDLPEIRTLPQIIGINNSKYVGTIALFLFFALEFFKVPKNESAILIISVVSFVSLLFLILSGKNRNRFYCSFWVESLPILWLLLLLI